MGAWKTVAAAVAGPKKGDRGCQDAVLVREVHVADRTALVVALADGAGSAKHGGDAARLIVAKLTSLVTGRLRRRWRLHPDSPGWDDADTRAVLERTRLAVVAAARSHHHALRDWSSTALLAILTDDATFYGHKGDGAFCVRKDGSWSCPVWPVHDGYVNVTTFLTDTSQPPTVLNGPPMDALLVFSDGLQPLALDYAAATPHTPFCRSVLAELERSPDTRVLRKHLMAWLRSPAIQTRTDDDTSLVMAIRRGSP